MRIYDDAPEGPAAYCERQVNISHQTCLSPHQPGRCCGPPTKPTSRGKVLPRHRRGHWQAVLGSQPSSGAAWLERAASPKGTPPGAARIPRLPYTGEKVAVPLPQLRKLQGHPGSGHAVEPAGVFTENVPSPISPRPNPTSALPVLSCRCPELSQHKHPARGPSPGAGFPGNPGLSFPLEDSDDPSTLGLCCLQGTRGDFSDAWMTK